MGHSRGRAAITATQHDGAVDDLVKRAREYAAAAHARINQLRKYTLEPYAVHLRAVADVVAGAGGDPAMVAAAWLHELVEDTPATFEDIEREFGPDVANLVRELTDVSRLADGNRAVRKALDREHTARASPRAKPSNSLKLSTIAMTFASTTRDLAGSTCARCGR